MAKIRYNIGEKLGECTYLGNDFYDKKTRKALFRCRCGNEFNASIVKIKTLHTSSCGCYRSKLTAAKNSKHGYSKRGGKPKEYIIWMHMKQRCTNSNIAGFKNWGGRGIFVCERWLHSFQNFIDDMGQIPDNCRGIDRVNNNDGYYKENCRWATYKEQCNNTRKNVIINFRGETKSLSMWVDELGLNYSKTAYQFRKGDKSPEEIFEMCKIIK